MIRICKRCIIRYSNFGNDRFMVVCTLVLLTFVVYRLSFPPKHLRLNSVVTAGRDLRRHTAENKKPEPSKSNSESQNDDCKATQLSFQVTSGTDKTVGPTIVINKKTIMSPEKANVGRGFNAVFLDPKTLKVVDHKVFDTYSEESTLNRYIRLNCKAGTIIVLASFDDAAFRLTADGRASLSRFGSKKINSLKFRNAIVIIGQYGLEEGSAIEFLSENGENEFGQTIKTNGCVEIPMGKIGDPNKLSDLRPAKFKIGDDLKNCGMEKECPKGEYSLYVDTGQVKKNDPKICFNGKMLMNKDLNDGGRGFNVAVINSTSLKVKAVQRFDTYEKDSLQMEVFLSGMASEDVLIAVVNDEGSNRLSDEGKKYLTSSFGSSLISELKFRDVWYIVTQHMEKRFTVYENISYADYDKDWPAPIAQKMCIKLPVPKEKFPKTSRVERNLKKRTFCSNYDGYAEFCDALTIDNAIKTVPLYDKQLSSNPVYKTPIIIIPGMNHNALVRTLETTLLQPGLDPKLVTVMLWSDLYPDYVELAGLHGFNIKTLQVEGSHYSDVVKEVITTAWDMHSDVNHMIFIEEDLVLASDFLYFMAQLIAVIDSDPTLLGISAFNYNGFKTVYGDPAVVHRVEEFPGLAYLLKKTTYTKYMKDRMDTCCSQRSWMGWDLGDTGGAEILVPDISRVHHQRSESMASENDLFRKMFEAPRATHLDGDITLKAVEMLTAAKYEEMLQNKLKFVSPLHPELLQYCINATSPIKFPSVGGNTVAVYYNQKSSDDYTQLKKLCHCFGLFFSESLPPKNLHRGLLRFFYDGVEMFFAGSKSEYFKLKPESWLLQKIRAS